jgi:hypothetical protein
MTETHRSAALAAFVLLFGFFFGTALPWLLHMGTGSYASLASAYSLQSYQEHTVTPQTLLPYLLSCRLRPFLFLWMSSFTAAGLLFHLAYGWYLAASAGLLLSLFVLRAGGEGLLWFACCIFPQWILYGAVGKQEADFLLHCRRRRSVIQVPVQKLMDGEVPELTGYELAAGETVGERVRFRESDLWKLGRMVGLCMVGCFLEAYLGTWTIKIFLKFFS